MRHIHSSPLPFSRRRFSAAATSAATLAAIPKLGAKGNQNSNLRILQIGAGGIGAMDRENLLRHPKVEFVGFCDIDRTILSSLDDSFPNAFKVVDYREAFAAHGKEFDAVLIDTPDFHHAPMMMTALEQRKHIYGQKPLVHQLDEMRVLRQALRKRPELVTQMGNQRASVEGRIQAVEMLKSDRLGRPLEAHIWTGELRRDSHFAAPWSDLPDPQPVPETMEWNLWNGPLTKPMPYSDDVSPRRWRAYWETGSGQLGDWGCHLIDVLFYAFNLPSPEAVQTDTIRPPGTGHSAHNQSTITFPGGDRFGRDKFVVRYCDSMIRPSFSALGLPPIKPGVNHTLVVCEEGALLLGDLGRIQVFRNGKEVTNEPLPRVAPHDHWSDWVDRCLGSNKQLWSPFPTALRITEPTLLSVKATRFPGLELLWDGANCRFTNSEKPNREILRRNYRDGFAPPSLT